MTHVPSHWRWVTLNDLQADEPRAITDGPFGSNLTSAHYTVSGPRVVRLQNIGDGKFVDAEAHISEEHFQSLRNHEVLPGDLLIASLGESPPRACLAPSSLGPAIVKADCIRARLSPAVEPRWVMYALQAPATRRWAADRTYGVGRPRLGLKTIRAIPIPLPPLPEQRVIVEMLEDHLSRLDAALASLDHALARWDALWQSAAEGQLTGRHRAGSRDDSSRLPDAGVDDGVLPGLPFGWKWSRLGDLADVVGGVTKDAKRQGDPSFMEVPYLRVANVQRGFLDLSSVTTIRVPPNTARSLRLAPGDVLLNEGGDRDKLGRGWVWDGQIDGCIHQNHVFRARVREDVIDPYLLSWAANSMGGRWCERNGRQSVNLASISLSKIRLMPIPVPPRADQHAILSRLQALHEGGVRLRRSVQTASTRALTLRRSLLTVAFAGKLSGQSTHEGLTRELADV